MCSAIENTWLLVEDSYVATICIQQQNENGKDEKKIIALTAHRL
jgi:hypothetical protein